MSTHYLSREIDHRDVLYIDYDPDTDSVLQIRIVREPFYTGDWKPQKETIARYTGDAAQRMYEAFQDVVLCPSGPGEQPIDLEDDQQLPRESTVPAVEPHCEPCET